MSALRNFVGWVYFLWSIGRATRAKAAPVLTPAPSAPPVSR